MKCTSLKQVLKAIDYFSLYIIKGDYLKFHYVWNISQTWVQAVPHTLHILAWLNHGDIVRFSKNGLYISYQSQRQTILILFFHNTHRNKIFLLLLKAPWSFDWLGLFKKSSGDQKWTPFLKQLGLKNFRNIFDMINLLVQTRRLLMKLSEAEIIHRSSMLLSCPFSDEENIWQR